MRGIEAALHVLTDVSKGRFASESLRRVSNHMTEGDRILASTLIYAVLRRQTLWRKISETFLRHPFDSLSWPTRHALVVGTAGILELKHFSPQVLVSALVDEVKRKGQQNESRIVNAVLHRVEERGHIVMEEIHRSTSFQDKALFGGIPLWVAYQWKDAFGQGEASKLINLFRVRPYASFRVLPQTNIPDLLENLKKNRIYGWPSPLVDYSVRTASFAFPPEIPGFNEGTVTVQSESSMLVAEMVRRLWKEGSILDMCAGRGIKTGQIATLLPSTLIEAWELSKGRSIASKKEMQRLSCARNVTIHQGDSLKMTPRSTPNLVFLDAPCSGSGTWSRHPESKWIFTKEKLEELVLLQKKLLKKAVEIVAQGGIILYSTCSLLRQENEQVIAEILAEDKSLVEMSLPISGRYLRKGRPWGTYIWPQLPWLDGFYMAAILKRTQEG